MARRVIHGNSVGEITTSISPMGTLVVLKKFVLLLKSSDFEVGNSSLVYFGTKIQFSFFSHIRVISS